MKLPINTCDIQDKNRSNLQNSKSSYLNKKSQYNRLECSRSYKSQNSCEKIIKDKKQFDDYSHLKNKSSIASQIIVSDSKNMRNFNREINFDYITSFLKTGINNHLTYNYNKER